MTEDDPFVGAGDLEPTKVQLEDPHVSSTFEVPLRPHALKAHEAAIRKQLEDRRPKPPPAE